MIEFQVTLGARIHWVFFVSRHTRMKTGIAPQVLPSLGSVAQTGSGTICVSRSPEQAARARTETAMIATMVSASIRIDHEFRCQARRSGRRGAVDPGLRVLDPERRVKVPRGLRERERQGVGVVRPGSRA